MGVIAAVGMGVPVIEGMIVGGPVMLMIVVVIVDVAVKRQRPAGAKTEKRTILWRG